MVPSLNKLFFVLVVGTGALLSPLKATTHPPKPTPPPQFQEPQSGWDEGKKVSLPTPSELSTHQENIGNGMEFDFLKIRGDFSSLTGLREEGLGDDRSYKPGMSIPRFLTPYPKEQIPNPHQNLVKGIIFQPRNAPKDFDITPKSPMLKKSLEVMAEPFKEMGSEGVFVIESTTASSLNTCLEGGSFTMSLNRYLPAPARIFVACSTRMTIDYIAHCEKNGRRLPTLENCYRSGKSGLLNIVSGNAGSISHPTGIREDAPFHPGDGFGHVGNHLSRSCYERELGDYLRDMNIDLSLVRMCRVADADTRTREWTSREGGLFGGCIFDNHYVHFKKFNANVVFDVSYLHSMIKTYDAYVVKTPLDDEIVNRCVCEETQRICRDSEPKLVEGKYYHQPCWDESILYDCKCPPQDGCNLWKYQNCTLEKQTCVSTRGPFCLLWQKTYRCPAEQKTKTFSLKKNSIFCLDGKCHVPQIIPNLDMAKSVAEVAGAASMADNPKGHFNAQHPTVFEGSCHTCSHYIAKAKNCCGCLGGSGWAIAIGMTGCSPEETELIEKRRRGLCTYVGSYEKTFLNIGYVKKSGYCCFPSKLARIIHEQGRRYVNKTFGSPESLRCDGFSIDELGRLPFEKIDFSEAFGDIFKNMPSHLRKDWSQDILNGLPEGIAKDADEEKSERFKDGIINSGGVKRDEF